MIDGAGVAQIYGRIMMPLSVPVLAMVAIFQTIGNMERLSGR
jgi:ABC-type glycerol-3-phosphate transport system permease component